MVRIEEVGSILVEGAHEALAVPQDDRCLLYTSDAADERSSVDLGGRRIIKKKSDCVLRGGHMRKILAKQRSNEVERQRDTVARVR